MPVPGLRGTAGLSFPTVMRIRNYAKGFRSDS
jgi:hypothetical protein